MATNKIVLNGKVLYKSKFHAASNDLLSSLDEVILYSIASTASTRKVVPTDKAEAIDTILLFTEDIERLFSYKKITSQMLIYYLYQNDVYIQGFPSKVNLMSKVLTLWSNKFMSPKNEENGDQQSKEGSHTEQLVVRPLQTEHKEDRFSEQEGRTEIVIPSTFPETHKSEVCLSKKVQSDEFSRKFVTWFYSCLNSISNSSDVTATAKMFCENATSDIFFVTPPSSEESSHADGNVECANSFHQIILAHKLNFNPSLENGVRAIKSPHGLVHIFCCGSLHHGDAFVGIFEQEFGLCQNPADKRWQIFITKINLKGSIYQVPSLPPSEIFEIEAGS